jgi:hypothetical protein
MVNSGAAAFVGALLYGQVGAQNVPQRAIAVYSCARV